MKKRNMLCQIQYGLAVLMAVLAAAGLPLHVNAQRQEGGIGYYIRAVIPENQIDRQLTYFDLRMTPGQAQTVEVEVVNEGDEPITIDVRAVSASTNRNGVIDYKTPDIRDMTLRHPFSELAVPESNSVHVEARQSARVRFTIQMPQEKYDGVVLGGLVFTKQDANIETNQADAALRNVYSYVLGVKLTETDTAVPAEFELESVRAESVNYQPAMVHSIRNRAAAIVKGMTLDLTIRDHRGNIVAKVHKENVDMAPNSVMPLAAVPDRIAEDAAGEAGGSGGSLAEAGLLKPGEYTSELTLNYGGESPYVQAGIYRGQRGGEHHQRRDADRSTTQSIRQCFVGACRSDYIAADPCDRAAAPQKPPGERQYPYAD